MSVRTKFDLSRARQNSICVPSDVTSDGCHMWHDSGAPLVLIAGSHRWGLGAHTGLTIWHFHLIGARPGRRAWPGFPPGETSLGGAGLPCFLPVIKAPTKSV